MKTISFKITMLISMLFFSMPAFTLEANHRQIELALDRLQLAINAHDFSLLESSLDESFSYQNQNPVMSEMIMKQVIEGYPHHVNAISILSVGPINDDWQVSILIELEDQPDQRQITLSGDYKIIKADIADISLAGHGLAIGATEKPARQILPATTNIPFELVGRLIMVTAMINGVYGNYLVDTGAQTIILNGRRFEEEDIEVFEMDHAPPKGAGGLMSDVRATRNLGFSWGAIQMDGLSGLVTDLSHLEKNLGGVELTGIIGFNVLEQFQVHFDYSAEQLILLALDDQGTPIENPIQDPPERVIPLDFVGHIPTLSVRIGKLDLSLGLDSGAAGQMIFTRWQDQLDGEYEFLRRDELTGADQNVQTGDVVRIPLLELGDLEYSDMTFRFNDLAGQGEKAMPMDGLLGYEFLKARPTAINFRAGQLLIWSAKSKPAQVNAG